MTGQVHLPAWQSMFSTATDSQREVVHARGELTLFTWELLRGAVDNLLATRHRRVTVDLAGVALVDRSAARSLLLLRQQLRARHRPLLLRNLPPTLTQHLRQALQQQRIRLAQPETRTGTLPAASAVSAALRIEQQPQATVLHLAGEIDAAIVKATCRPALHALPDRGRLPLLVDLAAVEFLDVVGLNLLLELRNRALRRGACFRLTDPPRQVRRLITAAGLDTVLLPPDPPAAAWYATKPARTPTGR